MEAWVNEKYHGNSHPFYGLKVPQKRKLTKELVKAHPDWKAQDWVHFLDSLYFGKSYEEKTIAGHLLEYLGPKIRQQLSFEQLAEWLLWLEGWAEIDSTCQSTFTAQELLDNWQEWNLFLKELNSSEAISHRRASLVIMCKPVGQSADTRLSRLSFELVEKLKSEKDILITKAISWLLRSLVDNYALEVKKYLERNKNSLPAIAVRETTRKLETGKK